MTIHVPVYIPKLAYVPTQTSLRLKNGNHPDAGSITTMMQETNRIIRYRGQELCSFSQRISAIETGSGVSWRAACHTSTHVRFLWAVVEYALIDTGGGTDMHVEVLVENGAGSDLGTATFRYGPIGSAALDTPDEFGTALIPVLDSAGELAEPLANTDYFITISHKNNARILACCVYEETLQPTTENGYLPSGVAVKGPILDVTRETMIPLLRNAWLHSAGKLWQWAASDVAAPTRVTTTYANMFDQTLTAASAASPGATICLSNRSTVRRGTVRTKFWVYAKMSAGTGTNAVMLYDSATNTAKGGVNVTSAVAAWYSTDIDLPATDAKYDVMFKGTTPGTCTLYAFSLLQYEA